MLWAVPSSIARMVLDLMTERRVMFDISFPSFSRRLFPRRCLNSNRSFPRVATPSSNIFEPDSGPHFHGPRRHRLEGVDPGNRETLRESFTDPVRRDLGVSGEPRRDRPLRPRFPATIDDVVVELVVEIRRRDRRGRIELKTIPNEGEHRIRLEAPLLRIGDDRFRSLGETGRVPLESALDEPRQDRLVLTRR